MRRGVGAVGMAGSLELIEGVRGPGGVVTVVAVGERVPFHFTSNS